MKHKTWTVTISATKAKIWRTMLDDATYRVWTTPFSEGSSAEGDWSEGSKILFTDGSGSGMVSRIAEHRPNEYLSIEHLGMLNDGVEDFSSDAVKGWAGARENYGLSGTDGNVTLTVDMDVTDEYEAMFDEKWPQALALVKELSEK